MKQALLFVIGLIFATSIFADDFYWVGNSGDWTEYDTHWATSSGGSIMHNRIPDENDIIYFDANSFSEAGAVVSVDTSFIACQEMIWSAVTSNPEIIFQSTDSLFIQSQLILSDNMSFNHFGLLRFENASPGQTLTFDAASHQISARIEIEIPNGSLQMLSNLNAPQKQILIMQGALNMNNHNLSFKHLNTDIDTPIEPTGNASLANVDTIYSSQSLYFHDILDVSTLNTVLFVQLQSNDNNYISFGNQTPDVEINISGSKICSLLGPLQTSGNINLDFNGEFYSNDFPISCQSFISNNSFARTIDLGSSDLETVSFIISGTALNLNSSAANLTFSGSNELLYQSSNLTKSFSSITIVDNANMIFSSGVDAGQLNIGNASNLFIKDNRIIEISALTTNGDCGSFSLIRGYCGNDPYTWPTETCFVSIPKINASTDITADYLKLAFIEGIGANFTATNSYDQGSVSNWNISEPLQTDILYWIGGQGNWNNPQNWSFNSGGTAQTCLPTRENSVVFDANSFSAGDSIFVDEAAYCKNMLWENIPANVILTGDAELLVSGNMTLHENLQADFTGTIHFQNEDIAGEDSIYTNHVILNSELIFSGQSAYDFADSLRLNEKIIHETGGLSFSGGYAMIAGFESMADGNRNLNIKKSEIILTGENTCWAINPTNLTFVSDTSQIILNAIEHDLQNFYGGNLIYDSVKLMTQTCQVFGDNSFGYLGLFPGKSVVFEALSITTLDSISANGSCDMPISLSSENSTDTAQIVKSGFPQVDINGIHISNLTADINGGIVYNATNSTVSGNTNGWTITGSPTGQAFYWLGNTKYWNDLSNWENDGGPATCLPGIMDTVIFEKTRLATVITDTVFINNKQYCKSLDASDTDGIPLYFVMDASLEIAQNINLHDSVSFEYESPITINELFDINEGIILAPNGEDAEIITNDADLAVNFFMRAFHEDDSIMLNSNIKLHDLAGIIHMSGTFVTNENNISTDVIRSSSDEMKHLLLDKSTLEIGFYAEFQDASTQSVSADSSLIVIAENTYNNAIFNGGDQQYYDIELNMSENGGNVDGYSISIIGSNHFNQFTVNPGGTVQFQGGSTTTLDSTLTVSGTCLDKIRFKSDLSGTVYNFTKTNTYQDTVYSLLVSDMNISQSTIAMLSTDQGGNSGITFDPTEAAVAQFDLPYPACIGDALTFNNQSQSIWGGMDNLEFEWTIVNIDTTNTVDLIETFNTQGEYIIHLLATDTLTHCFDQYTDTIQMVNHSANISASPASLIICDGENLEFTGGSNQTVDYEFYLNENPLGLGGSVSNYSATDFSDGDEVFVETIFEGCSKFSDTLTITVNPLPNVVFTSDPADATICDGESITFTASGADLYHFYIDGNPVTGMTSTNQFTSSVLTDGAVVSVETQMLTTACTAWNDTDITVTVNDNPTVSLTADISPAIICAGETIEFTGSGADVYEFFVNGTSQGAASTDNIWTSSTLEDGDIITVEGSSTAGCSSLSSFINVTVNPAPELAISSDVAGNEICAGETLNFTATGAAEYLFFLDGNPEGDFAAGSEYGSSSFTDGQTLQVAGRIGDCYDTLTPAENIIVHPNIELSASIEAICPGETIEFTASGDSQYQFYINGTEAGSLSPNPIFSSDELNNGDIVSLTGTAGACLPEPIEITVYDLPIPVFTSSDADSSICDGDEIIFTASGADEYEFFVNGVSNGVSVVNTISSTDYDDESLITLSGYSPEGCFAQSEDSITIEVRPLPNVSLTSSDPTSICFGDEVSIQASGADTYEFFNNGVSLGAPSVQNEITLNNLENNDEITLIGTSLACSAEAPESLNYTVFNIPVVSLQAISETSVCLGDEISIEASGATEYEFFVNEISQGSANSNPIFSSETLSDGDLITVVGYQNICADTADNSVSVNVNPIPDMDLITDIPANGLCFGDTIHISASGAAEYEFILDGYPISTISETNELLLSEYFNGQIISVRGYNNSCMREVNQPDTIILNRVFTSISTNTSGAALCDGTTVTANAEGADEYEFFLDGTSVSDQSSESSLTYSPITDGQVMWVVGTDLNTGCSEPSSEITFSVQDNPEIIVDPSESFCQNDSVLLSVFHDNGHVRWYHNDIMIDASGSEIYVNQGGAYQAEIIRGHENTVYTAGNNESGQLGVGNTTQSEQPIASILSDEMTDIAAGQAFMLALDQSGQVFAWGDNSYGAIGNGSYSDAYTPVNLPIAESVTAIAAGHYHSLAILSDSTLIAWGKNDMGQLGYGNLAASNFPNPVLNLSQIIAVSAGKNHSLALDADGNVYAWGNNAQGQLGTGDFETQHTPVQIDALSNIQEIICGGNHNLALDINGRVWVWGANESGQLGLGDQNNRTTPVMIQNFHEINLIAAGLQHSLAYNTQGKTYAWGSNANSQLGIPSLTEANSPREVDITGIKALYAGTANSFAIRNDNSVWAWGQNNAAQLTLGHNNTVVSPEQSSNVFGIQKIAAGNEFTGMLWQDGLVCNSETINLTMLNIPEVAILQNENILSVTEGVTWQWFLNNSEIPGANESQITVSAEGNYSVLIDFANGCSLHTDAISIGNAIASIINENAIEIAPNPASDCLNIYVISDVAKQLQSWEIINTQSEIVMKSNTAELSDEMKLDVSELAPAVYYIRMYFETQSVVKKLVIQ
jgi:alpha-tubulin suppressor-like RCC1 family protein